MTNFAKKLLLLILLVIFGSIYLYFFFSKEKPKDVVVETPKLETENKTTDSLLGCYVATLGKDIYTLNIEKQDGNNVSGNLSYKNFEKDSSSGTFNGTINSDILLGNYSFDSEGMHSDSEVIFKLEGDNFIQGFGSVKVSDSKQTFEDVSKVTYDPKSTFKKQGACTPPKNDIIGA